jgi:mono/diheme cytochrome c family protein
MTQTIRTRLVLTVTLALTGAMVFAEGTGAATYKAKCATCHGIAGVPTPAMARAMRIKPATDPDIKKLTVEQIAAVVKEGKGKMKPPVGLNAAQIKDVAAYYHELK